MTMTEALQKSKIAVLKTEVCEIFVSGTGAYIRFPFTGESYKLSSRQIPMSKDWQPLGEQGGFDVEDKTG